MIRGAVRRMAALPLRLAGSWLRAEVLQELSQKTLSVCSVGRGAITFYAPKPLASGPCGFALYKRAGNDSLV